MALGDRIAFTWRTSPQAGPQGKLKRALDIAAAAAGLLATAPVVAGVAVAVRLRMGSPVLFRQARGGYHERIIYPYKFRTMNDDRSADGELLPDGDRLTALGSFLRRYSLDEVPQLFSVLKGDMSLVGPRPFTAQYIGLYDDEQRRRHEVIPGITGLAQVNGRNDLTWEGRFERDLEYVETWSLWLDAKILFATFGTVLRGSGVAHGAHVTMPFWKGSQPAAAPGPTATSPAEPEPPVLPVRS